MIACIVTEFLTYNVQCIYLQFQSFKGPKGPPGEVLTGQLADKPTRGQSSCGLVNSPTANF